MVSPRKSMKNDPAPLYFKLQKHIKENIENGKWGPEDALPPDREIARVQGLSVGTVQKALLNLVSEGYLYRVQGKGTFVSGTAISRESLRYVHMRKDFSEQDTKFIIHPIEMKKVGPADDINFKLQVRSDAGLIMIRRVFEDLNGPIVYNISHLPARMFPGFIKKTKNHLKNKTLYKTIEELYTIPTLTNMELFSVESSDRETSRFLKVDTGTPLLKIEMLSFTYKEKPYEYRQSYCLTGADKKIFREL
jgi:DNA-binding GntR family transcriptional regulator